MRHAKPTPRVTILVPAYNEEKRIGNTLEKLLRFSSCEILVVSESTDKTNGIVLKLSQNVPNLRLVTSVKRLGKGGAFKKGVKNSRGEIIVLLDSDFPVLASDVENIISSIGKADVAVASREIEGTRIMIYPPLMRVFAGKVFANLVNFLFKLQIKDPQCGCKAFKKEVLDAVLPVLDSDGFDFDTELLVRCKRLGYIIKEIPVNWSYKPDSKVNLWKDAILMGRGVLKLWIKTRVATHKN